MSIKRVAQIFKRDLLSNFRDKIVMYMLFAPVLLAILVRLFIPDVQAVSMEFGVVSSQASPELVAHLQGFGKVETFRDRGALEARVRMPDDLLGIAEGTAPGAGLEVLAQGNEGMELVELSQMVVNDFLRPPQQLLTFSEIDLGNRMPLLLLFGMVMVVMMSFLLGGMVIGFNIIEEKESGTLPALNVTPLSHLEYFVGRSLMGLVFPIIHTFVGLWILGITGLNPWMVLATTLFGSGMGILTGLFIGATSKNQLNGIANLKISMLVLVMPVMFCLFLPSSRLWVFYWAPTYWIFQALKDILLQNQSWGNLGMQLLWVTLTTLLFVAAFFRKIRSGLTGQ
ncbi:MAG TPA: ABC transporter permease [Thermotogota bacterium]|nr:ABC transporter permease [Thermotogota bacterium]